VIATGVLDGGADGNVRRRVVFEGNVGGQQDLVNDRLVS